MVLSTAIDMHPFETSYSSKGAKREYIRYKINGVSDMQNLTDNSYVLILPDFLTTPVCQGLQREMGDYHDTFNERPTVKVFGKEYKVPRGQVAFGDGLYSYSNLTVEAQPMPKYTTSLTHNINCMVDKDKVIYNFVLVNEYKNGQDKVGKHTDDERSLDPHYPIMSYSLGATRRFIIRPSRGTKLHSHFAPSTSKTVPLWLKKFPTEKVTFEIALENNMLMTMGGAFQKEFTHEVPRESHVHKPRWNFTFRALHSNTK
jgi:DNA oxidative demethylase